MNAQTRGLAQAQRNAQDGISMIQTAEGALKETHSILQRMRELSVQAANDSNTGEDRDEIQEEMNQLHSEITRIADTTEFNTKSLLDGSLDSSVTGGSALTFHIGANSGQNTTLDIRDMKASGANLGLASAVSVTTQADADAAIATIDSAIGEVSTERSKLGAMQNRLDHTINNLSTSEENLTAANSRIKDVDMAKEMMNLSKQQILSQAGTAMLAQANQMPQGVLQLLG
jgi:flagellin